MGKLILFGAILARLLAAQTVDLTILHFNDFHAKLKPTQGRGGAAHLATAIARERENCARCLLLNAGDNVQGSPVSTIYRGLPVFEVLRPLRADAFVLGNHEFDYGADRINDFLAAAGLPILAANLLTPEGALFTGAASVIVEREGLRIGVVGVLMDDLVPKLTTPARLGANKLLPALDTLRLEAAKLKGQTDVLVALVHLWKEQCDQIVAEIPEYSVVVSGHDHGGMTKPFVVDSRYGVRLRANASELGRLDLKYDKSARKIMSATWRIIPITTAEYPADAEVAAIVDRWEKKVDAVVDVPIGTNSADRNRDWLRTWIERVMRERTGSDFAHMNAGGIRDVLPAGTVLARNIWNIAPFDNLLVTGKIKGSLIPDFIRGNSVLDPDKIYSVSTLDFVVETMRSPTSKFRDFALAMPLDGPLLRDVLIDWVKQKTTIE